MSKSAAAERIPGPASLTRRRVAHLWRHPPSRHGSAAVLPPRASICTATVSVFGWSWYGPPGPVLAAAGCGAGSCWKGARAPPRASVLYGYGRGCQHAGSSAQLCLQAGEKRAAREYRCRMKTARGLRVRCAYHRGSGTCQAARAPEKDDGKRFRGCVFGFCAGRIVSR